jgi:hypothetical protein
MCDLECASDHNYEKDVSHRKLQKVVPPPRPPPPVFVKAGQNTKKAISHKVKKKKRCLRSKLFYVQLTFHL